MVIGRRGSEKDHGQSTVKLENPRFSWDSKNGCIAITKTGVRDFTGQSKHDYHISVSLAELAEMLDTVSDDPAVDSPGAVASAFAKSLRSLMRLTTVSIGGSVSRDKE